MLYYYSQLPVFLGGMCSCQNEGGCLRSEMGPWNDPELMKVCTFKIWGGIQSLQVHNKTGFICRADYLHFLLHD